ncbi:hypothetical protein BJF90_15825 [Pseudonocardia sp. CNS-004]|nr:hypothetical protein BJF90_15825 [Pseudonocardia sp. CNS-004]
MGGAFRGTGGQAAELREPVETALDHVPTGIDDLVEGGRSTTGRALQVVEGAVAAPTAPGWGITLDPRFEETADVTTSARETIR